MIVTMAAPRDDELVYSVLARTREMLGPVADAAFLEVAFGRRVDALGVHLPLGVRRVIPLLTRGDAIAFIQAHTHYNYHAHWIGPQRAGRVLNDLLDPQSDGAGRNAMSLRGAAPWHRTLTFCRECADGDMLAYGETFWHAHHQLPGVFYCAQHDVPLVASTVTAFSQPKLETCRAGVSGSPLPCPFQPQVASRLSRLSHTLHKTQAVPVEAASVQSALRTYLRRAGWIAANGMGRTGLLDAVMAHYGADTLASFGLRLDGLRRQHDIQGLWGMTDHPRGPAFWNVLMLDFLEVNPQEFLGTCQEATEGVGQGPKRPPNPRLSKMNQHKSALAAALRQEPRPNRAELRCRAQRAYDYLRLNDPEWLDAVLPPRRQRRYLTNWCIADAAAVAAVPDAVAAVPPNRQRRPSFSAVAAALGMRSKLWREASRLPRTAALVRALTSFGSATERRPECAR